jgi:hypothetical protein
MARFRNKTLGYLSFSKTNQVMYCLEDAPKCLSLQVWHGDHDAELEI